MIPGGTRATRTHDSGHGSGRRFLSAAPLLLAPLLLAALLPAAFLLAGCSQTEERPIVIPDSSLAVILADLHLADARSRLPGGSLQLRDSILAYHGVNQETFERAMDGLVAHPNDLVVLYNSVLDQLNAARTPQSGR